jgi:NTP pyrophosphatase (non-canonical NTP hydrolase)
MCGNEYQKLAMRTNDGKATERLNDKLEAEQRYDFGGIIDAALGLSGEVGELNDLLKKWVFHKKPFHIDHAKKELGDIMWYVAMMCQSMGWELDDILQTNIDKLKARYPDGFDAVRANNRQEGDV